MKPNKVKSFTLAEMLVVLVVASIVISMAFLVLNMVRKQVSSIQQNYNKKQLVNTFETFMSRDFNNNIASYDSVKEQLVLSSPKDSIVYLIKATYVIREKDTFAISIKNKKLFLEGNEVKNNRIDALEINLDLRFSNKKLFFFQHLDASYYVNQ
jgi:type II secretory pathway pseudopilin PulG